MKAFDPSGLHVALATPFLRDGALDLAGFRHLVRYVARGGADVLVALGTTGEAPMLDDRERDQVIATCVEAADGVPVVVGTGAHSTSKACAFTARAHQLGASAALVVTPYYVRPTQQGIVAHLRAIADAAPGLPLIAYNVPSRTGTNIEPQTVAELWQIDELVAVKESSGNMAQIEAVAREVPPDRFLLAGDDAMAVPTFAVGGRGVVSVLGNLLPGAMQRLVTALRAGDFPQARRLHDRLLPAMNAVMCEPNPIPVKAGLELLGLGADIVRLPLLPAQASTRRRLREVLEPIADLLPEGTTLGASTPEVAR